MCCGYNCMGLVTVLKIARRQNHRSSLSLFSLHPSLSPTNRNMIIRIGRDDRAAIFSFNDLLGILGVEQPHWRGEEVRRGRKERERERKKRKEKKRGKNLLFLLGNHFPQAFRHICCKKFEQRSRNLWTEGEKEEGRGERKRER